jgi:hypothetical protein
VNNATIFNNCVTDKTIVKSTLLRIVKILSQLKISSMKKVQKILVAFVLVAIFTSCQSGKDAKQTLSNTDTRKDIMNTIAADSSMHQEMMAAMMNGKSGMMMGDHAAMMKMMKDNPDMMKSMMNEMMDMCKNDTAMMGGMCKTMMANPQMIEMMKKMNGENMGMDKMNMDKMKGMDTMKNMNHTQHH